ncbi:hypothetical protein RO3G_09667 [Rhizopus delemar RA 99-880]|uniref:Uncharacterized protein n=1 Tax=Rhizopus delemar (strain RA 99-880 / ATCC MYA-4621 / FGSC 9543 / NRRL 43880) TaxID=246409 RepID=I1C927_RHIO9|nr:hypothetical protein RO3G_09667 [Rhizopus delemar RA 99-880]|eukprot:EIE84957.1 hypothetical protein RO3G_09667 [Rhizopus delemar RA 99-880]
MSAYQDNGRLAKIMDVSSFVNQVILTHVFLIYVFCKILERCLYSFLVGNRPILDMAQGDLREAHESLEQVLCLAEFCNILPISSAISH